ncbi:MAG: isopenicillin N synthase family dioxygenase [bacterium]
MTESLTQEAPGFSEIPVVSLRSWRGTRAERQDVADALVRACHEVGFFLLVDHGIDQRLIDRYFAALEQFFALPIEAKELMAKANSRHFRGWEAIGAELTNNRVDYREQIDLSSEHAARDADVWPPYLRLDGPNQWLPDEMLPGFREVVTEYFAQLSALAGEVMSVLALGLRLPPETFTERFGERPLSFMKLISYPPTPEGQAGVNGHHDAGFLTLLMQHGVGGLQVENQRGEWIDVPPTDDAFVVNLGEMLQSMTGNYLVATNHRVIAPAQRYSSAYFHGPDLRGSLAPLALDEEFVAAVEASPRHRKAGFMARREQLLDGEEGLSGHSVSVFGEQMWNYYVRSYPDLVRAHYPETLTAPQTPRE